MGYTANTSAESFLLMINDKNGTTFGLGDYTLGDPTVVSESGTDVLSKVVVSGVVEKGFSGQVELTFNRISLESDTPTVIELPADTTKEQFDTAVRNYFTQIGNGLPFEPERAIMVEWIDDPNDPAFANIAGGFLRGTYSMATHYVLAKTIAFNAKLPPIWLHEVLVPGIQNSTIPDTVYQNTADSAVAFLTWLQDVYGIEFKPGEIKLGVPSGIGGGSPNTQVDVSDSGYLTSRYAGTTPVKYDRLFLETLVPDGTIRIPNAGGSAEFRALLTKEYCAELLATVTGIPVLPEEVFRITIGGDQDGDRTATVAIANHYVMASQGGVKILSSMTPGA